MATQTQWTPRLRRVTDSERERLTYVGTLVRDRRLDDARSELESLLRQNARSFGANVSMGWVCNYQRKAAEALIYFKRAASIDPKRVQPHIMAGYCYLQLRDLDSARSSFEAALEIDPKLPGAHFGMAQVLQRSGDFDAALKQIGQVLRVDPLSSPARLLLANVLRRSGKIDLAIKELEAFLKLVPENFQAYNILSGLYNQEGNHHKAAEMLEAAVKLRPNSVALWGRLGRARMQVNDYEGAEAAYREVARLRPRGRTSSLRLIEALIPQAKFDEALEIIRKIPRRGRIGAMLYKYSGDIFAAQKRNDEAVQSYRAAVIASAGGEKLAAEIDAASQANGDSSATVKLYQAAIADLEEAARKRMAEQDWQKIFEQMQTRWAERLDAPLANAEASEAV
jgi:tetratricopeptide (TPR) repeat protein